MNGRNLIEHSSLMSQTSDVLVLLKFCKILVSARFCGVCAREFFHALTLRLPIQTSLSVVPKRQVSLRSGEKCENFRKTSTSQ